MTGCSGVVTGMPTRLLAIVLSVVCLASATSAGADDRLVALTRAQGVSGFEGEVRQAITGLLPHWASPRTDEAGDPIVTLGQGAPHVLVVASIDEDGYLVSDVTDDGFLRLTRVSTGASFRLFDQFIYGQPVVIRTAEVGGSARSRGIPGVSITQSTHLQRGRDASTALKGLDDIWVDVGASSKTEVGRLGIRLLDTVGLSDRVQELADGRVAGVAAQARSGGAALLGLLDNEGGGPPKPVGTITVAWVAQGLFGDRGMARLAQTIKPDRVIVLARSTGSREVDPRGALGRLGSGPVLPESDAALIQAAKLAGVPFQTVARLQGTTLFGSAKVQTLAIPMLFAQTPVETVARGDVDATRRLLRALTGLPRTSLETQVVTAHFGAEPPPGIFGLLQPLVRAYGVSGHEATVREAIAKRLPAWAKPQVDAHGNLVVSFGQGRREIAFVAHTDELGYEITDLREDGTASVRKRGGFFDNLHEAHPILVHTARGIVTAIVPPRPGYQRATDAQPRAEDVLIDFGTTTRAQTEALGVVKGDAATVRKDLVKLAGTRGTARAIDDRAGCAAMLAALAKIDPAKVGSRVTFAWVVEEETGLAGSGALAERLHPDYVFAVDTFVSSDSPVDPQRMAHIPLGTGAVLRAVDNSSITPPAVVARIRALAAARAIPTTVGVTSGGNDGSQFSRYGSIVVPISWPGRYSHSPVEVVDSRDLDALVRLIVVLANEFPGQQ